MFLSGLIIGLAFGFGGFYAYEFIKKEKQEREEIMLNMSEIRKAYNNIEKRKVL